MNANDNDEERLSRIEHMLKQLLRDARTLNPIAAKVNVVVEATRSLSGVAKPAPAMTDRRRA